MCKPHIKEYSVAESNSRVLNTDYQNRSVGDHCFVLISIKKIWPSFPTASGRLPLLTVTISATLFIPNTFIDEAHFILSNISARLRTLQLLASRVQRFKKQIIWREIQCAQIQIYHKGWDGIGNNKKRTYRETRPYVSQKVFDSARDTHHEYVQLYYSI